MVDALRRLLWLIPVFGVGAIVSFLALSTLCAPSVKSARTIFYNPHPMSAEIAAELALEELRERKPGSRERLSTLGGAALPTILKNLPASTVADQREIALALGPVVRRMGLERASVSTGLTHAPNEDARILETNIDVELLFWERYRVEHGLDLRPLAASRLVRRLADRPTPRKNADLLAVDTYALPFLISSLGRMSSESDVARARRIVSTIARLTGKDWKLQNGASTKDAQRLLTKIRNYWDTEGPKWTQLDRFSLLVSRFTQTEFAGWIFRTSRQVSGVDHWEISSQVLVLGRSSLPLFFFSLLGMLVFGPIVAAAIKMLELRKSKWTLQTWGIRAGLSILLLSLIVLLLVAQEANILTLSIVSFCTGCAYSTFILHREINDRLDWRTHHVLRSRHRLDRAQAIAQWIAPSIPTFTPIAVTEAALWVTCLEVGAKSPGLGLETILAIQNGNLDFLMSVCLGLGLITGTSQVLADLVLVGPGWRQGETS